MTHQRLRVGSKKHALSLPEGSLQQGRSRFYAQSVRVVREHGKMTRTPLAAFFNRPCMRHWHGEPASPHHMVILSRRRRICAKIEEAHLGEILRFSQDAKAYSG